MAAGNDWLPRKVRVSWVNAKVLSQTMYFGEAEVESNQTVTAIAFPKELLAHHIAERCSSASSMMQNGKGVTCSATAPGILNAVDTILGSLFEFESVPTLERMAERFGVSGRTLQRLLTTEGSSYRELSERLLFRRAVTLLDEPHRSIKMIAADLGYGTSSSFIRAFGRIAGMTPMAYRKIN